MPDAPQDHVFQAYPATPGAVASATFRVTVEG